MSRGLGDVYKRQHLRSLTQLLERSPEYVFLMESKLLHIFQVRATIFRNIALFLSEVVELRIYQVQDIISSEVHLIQQV